MDLKVIWNIFFSVCGLAFTASHQQVQFGQVPQQQQQQQQHMHGHPPPQGQIPVVNGIPQPHLAGSVFDKSQVHDRQHIKEHLEGVIQQTDTSKMTEQELQFHYFKMHDNDNNNKLDGCELIKSLIHWHVSEGQNPNSHVAPKLFADEELTMLIDPILESDDANKDGFIDYPEFAAAQARMGARV